MVGSINGQHTYATAGVYYVAVTITDPNGGSDTQSLQVTVNASVPTVTATIEPADASSSPPNDSQDNSSGPRQGGTGDPVIADSGSASTPQNTVTTFSGTSLSSSADLTNVTQATVNPDDSIVPAAADSSSSPAAQPANQAVPDQVTGVSADPTLLAAVAKALGLAAGSSVSTAKWASLTTLTADSNQVLSLQGIQNAVNLQSLTLVPSDFSDPGHLTGASPLAPLAGLTNLKSLTLQDCDLNDTSIGSLPSLPALTTLDLRYNAINTVPSAVAMPACTVLSTIVWQSAWPATAARFGTAPCPASC